MTTSPASNTISGVYRKRTPHTSGYYQCVENHFEILQNIWDDHYASRYGFWRPYLTQVICQYLDCGDLHMGFARIRCDTCGHEFILGFSCKRRHFCPSCHQKRVLEYGEWLTTEVLKDSTFVGTCVPTNVWFPMPCITFMRTGSQNRTTIL